MKKKNKNIFKKKKIKRCKTLKKIFNPHLSF